jgi:hypothetical protein
MLDAQCLEATRQALVSPDILTWGSAIKSTPAQADRSNIDAGVQPGFPIGRVQIALECYIARLLDSPSNPRNGWIIVGSNVTDVAKCTHALSVAVKRAFE